MRFATVSLKGLNESTQTSQTHNVDFIIYMYSVAFTCLPFDVERFIVLPVLSAEHAMCFVLADNICERRELFIPSKNSKVLRGLITKS